jgi:hypothetical protein
VFDATGSMGHSSIVKEGIIVVLILKVINLIINLIILINVK